MIYNLTVIKFVTKMIVRLSMFFLLCTSTSLAGTRLYFSKCGLNGFTCVLNGTKIVTVKYDCPKNVNDVIFFINQFTSPSTIERLEIKNCHTLTLSTRCSGENKRIQHLLVANIQRLTFQRLQYDPMLPPMVIFENISYIDAIPFRTFAQIEKSYYSIGCYVQPVDFQNLFFRNVSIDIIQSNAFVVLNQFKNFTFVDVTIKTIQTSGIRVKLDFSGLFEVKNSRIAVLEHLAIQMYTKRSIFTESQFTEIASSGINGTVEDFYFTDNFVETVHPYGFSILASNIFFLKNSFLHLKSAALEKLSPGLIQESGRNFGKLKFIYDFSKNSLNFLDAGSLNPDYVSYENVQTEMMFSRNKFLCSCENLGWLFSSLGHGPNTAQLEPFYEMVLDQSYSNICDKPYGNSCDLPLNKIAQLIKCGKCLNNVSMENLCEEMTDNGLAVEKVAINFTEEEHPEELANLVNERVLGSESVNTIFHKNYILAFLFVFILICRK